MKAYLRLMFVELILFIGLGLFCNRPEEVKQQNQEPPEIGQVLFQKSILPVSSRLIPVPLFSSDYPDHPGQFSSNPKHLENLITKRITNQFSQFSSDFANRRPELVLKAGVLLQSLTDSEEPPLL